MKVHYFYLLLGVLSIRPLHAMEPNDTPKVQTTLNEEIKKDTSYAEYADKEPKMMKRSILFVLMTTPLLHAMDQQEAPKVLTSLNEEIKVTSDVVDKTLHQEVVAPERTIRR